MNYTWLTKRRRYDGSETVVAYCFTEDEARNKASEMNINYQSDRYYAEKYVPAKASGF